jgi:predicted dehydrogenase
MLKMEKRYKWGILGAGLIANKFAEGLAVLPQAECYAVSARSLERAERFRHQHGFQKAYGSYQEMLADPQVDVVYIATTNNFHFEHSMMCLESGKPVLCEKPFASNLGQVKLMVEKSAEKNLFLMEALWTRFIPSMIRLKEEVVNGRVGKPRMLQCDFGFVSPFDPHHRDYAPELGGGSVPDIGIYPIFVSMFLFGKPETIQVTSVPAPTGTDWTTSILFKHRGGEISMLSSSFEAILDNEAKVFGENGRLRLHPMFHMPVPLSFQDNEGMEVEVPLELKGNGYNYEASEVMACLDSGRLESERMSHAFSLELMEVLDDVVHLARESN